MDGRGVRRREFVLVAAVGMLAASLVGCARAGTTAQTAGPSAGAVPPSAGVGSPAATAQVDSETEFYVVPSAISTEDGTLYSHLVGASAASDVLVAVGTDTTFVPASSGSAVGHLQWFSSASQSVSFGSPASGSVETVANVGVPLTSLSRGSLLYAQVDDTVVAFSGGHVQATYQLPTLQPDPAVGGLPAGYKGVFGGVSAGQVSALVPTADGHVLAFTSTGLASAITDLMTGKTTQLAGYGTLGSAVQTPSGSIDVLAWRGYQSTYSLHLLSLDGTSLSLGASMDTGLLPAGYLRDRLVSVAGHDCVLSVAQGDEATGVTLSVFSVDGTDLTSATAAKGVGLEIAPGPAGTVYLFGGPAANTVSQLDLVTRMLTRDLPALRAPNGAYVVGIAGS